MRKELAFLLIILAAVLGYLIGYSTAPTTPYRGGPSSGSQRRAVPPSHAPGYGGSEPRAAGRKAAPAYGSPMREEAPRADAPGYGIQGHGSREAAPGYGMPESGSPAPGYGR